MGRRLGSAVGVLILLVGLPVVLARWRGWPLPREWPDRQQWQQWLDRPLTEDSLTGAVAVVAWLLWLMLVYALLAELLRRLRRGTRVLRRLPRLPLPTPMQGLAGGVLGAVALTAPANHSPTVVEVSTADAQAALQPGAPMGEQPAPDVSAGVELPDGGWLPDRDAHRVDAAAALVWWRRRHRYRPRPLSGPDRDDPDLAALPATVAAVQAALADGTEPDGETAVWQDDLMLGVEDLPAGGVGLTGAGAGGAARGALVTLLLSHPPDTAARRPRVVTTRADLRALLGSAADAHGGTPGLHVADNLPDALAILDQVLLDAARRAEPVMLLAATPDDPALARRLAVLLRLGADHGLSGLIIGGWAYGTTWTIDPEGTSTGGVRLCTVGAAAAADLLAVAALRTQEILHAPTVPPIAASKWTASTGVTDAVPGRDDTAAVRVQMLGRFAVTSRGQPIHMPRSAATQILALLALHDEGVTTEQLTAAIWPHLRPHAAAGRCYTAVSVLRTTLRNAADGHEIITRVGERYQLNYTAIAIDVLRLRQMVLAAGTALLPAQREAHLRAVVDLYRGELAAEQPWPWLAPHREAIRRHVIDALVSLAANNPDQAVDLLQKAVRVDPVNEYLYQQAVQALRATGDDTGLAALRDRVNRHLTEAGPPTPHQTRPGR